MSATLTFKRRRRRSAASTQPPAITETAYLDAPNGQYINHAGRSSGWPFNSPWRSLVESISAAAEGGYLEIFEVQEPEGEPIREMRLIDDNREVYVRRRSADELTLAHVYASFTHDCYFDVVGDPWGNAAALLRRMAADLEAASVRVEAAGKGGA